MTNWGIRKSMGATLNDPKIRRYSAIFVEAIIYLNVSWVLVGDYLPRLTAFTGMEQQQWFLPGNFVEEITTGDGIDPYRGRVLVPLIVMGLGKLDDATINALDVAQIQRLFYLVVLAGLLFVIRIMMTTYGFSKPAGVAASLFIASILPLALRDHSYQAWSWLEAVIFPLVVIMTLRRSKLAFFVLVAFIAALNRETAILLPLIPLAVAIARRRGRGIRSYIYMAVTLGISAVTVRLFLMFVWPGPASESEASTEILRDWNLIPDNLAATKERLIPFIVVLIVAALVGLLMRNAPKESVWIAALTAPAFFVVWFEFALWWEVRVLLPFAILLLPVAFSSLFGPARPIPNLDLDEDIKPTQQPTN